MGSWGKGWCFKFKLKMKSDDREMNKIEFSSRSVFIFACLFFMIYFLNCCFLLIDKNWIELFSSFEFIFYFCRRAKKLEI